MPRTAPTPIDRHAAENLRYIRNVMASASGFTAVPGWGGVMMGLTAVGSAFLSGPPPALAEAPGSGAWLRVWMADAVVAVTIGLVAVVLKSRRLNTPFIGPGVRRFALAFLPALVAGGVLTPVLVAEGLTRRLPGCWLLLYGAGVTSGGALSVRVVPIMGVCLMALGAVAFLVPSDWGHLMLAAGFGVLQIGFGYVIARKHGG